MVTTPTTSHTIDGKPPLATVAMTETGHFLFVLRGSVSVGGVVPGQLGAGLHDPDGKEKKKDHKWNNLQNPEAPERTTASSPVGEEGDDGEGRVMGVREDVLDEKVRLAAVLWAEPKKKNHDQYNQ